MARFTRPFVTRATRDKTHSGFDDPSPSDPGHAPSVDFAALAALRETAGEMFTKLIRTFLGDTPAQLSILEAAVNSGDLMSLRSTAERLKRGSGNIGALALYDACIDLERLCDSGRHDYLHDAVARVNSQYQKATGLLEQMLNDFDHPN
jgi:HPt (histidine-containing phosphotransfer) domain-containing protein